MVWPDVTRSTRPLPTNLARHTAHHQPSPPPRADTTLSELNSSLVREEEGLVAGRGLVSCYAGSVAAATGGLLASGPTAAALNDNQVRAFACACARARVCVCVCVCVFGGHGASETLELLERCFGSVGPTLFLRRRTPYWPNRRVGWASTV
jgi:hypothetical protein